jgi:uncharacterized protein
VDETIEVEVAYALPERQLILKLEVPQGTTAIEAVRLSGIEEQFPEIELGKNRLGVFGKLCKPERTLQPGDRVEIYRPLDRGSAGRAPRTGGGRQKHGESRAGQRHGRLNTQVSKLAVSDLSRRPIPEIGRAGRCAPRGHPRTRPSDGC